MQIDEHKRPTKQIIIVYIPKSPFISTQKLWTQWTQVLLNHLYQTNV